MAFAALEPGMRHWFDAPAPEGTGACVAYVETRGGWVAACSPLVDAPDAQQLARAGRRFIEAARSEGRRACFFACEALEGDGLRRQLIGEQPCFRPRDWLRELPARRRLKEQLRRARAKGVQVRRVRPEELSEGSPLRRDIERLASEWLRSRRMEPMGFLVALELFHFPAHHRYFVAQRQGRSVGFLSAVPIGARRGWLVEDVVRSRDAPNGTTESMLVGVLRDVEDSEIVTLGLTPLSGAVGWPLRFVRWLTRPLFDFQGLHAFRERLRPDAWEPVWLVYPTGTSPILCILDALRAFARGSLTRFGRRSLLARTYAGHRPLVSENTS
jgi:phosphatidylglycerol lysyltransferase